ncbi:MAG: response regulator [Bryobacterales bacterium]|nr:response regulator [Bryobacterales bacterium]
MRKLVQGIRISSLLTLLLGVLLLIAAGLAIRLLRTDVPPRGEYVIGSNHSPPFQLVQSDGTITGPLVETFELAAQRLGITLKWVATPHPPDRYLSDKESGIDLWPLVMRLPERKGRFHITEPYTGSQYLLFSKTDYSAVAELPPDLVVGYARFRYTSELFRQNFALQKPFETDKPTDLMNAVCEDRLDAAVVETNAVDAFLQELPRNCGDGRIFLKSLPNWRIDLGVGARFGREDVANALRSEIGRLARSGKLDPIFDKYLALDRIRHRNLFISTRNEELARELTLSLLACIAALGILTATVITQRRKRILAQSVAASKTAFLAAMSHEIRTPLTGVLGMAELLSHSSLDPQQASYLDQIRSAGQRLLTIVNDVLVLSKLEAGRMQFQPEMVNVKQLLDETLAPLSLLADRKQLELVLDMHAGVPEMASLDRMKTGQIITNLVGNAVKFTETGGIRLTVSLGGTPAIARYLRFVVTDTGVGISKENLGRIFESYGQVQGTTPSNGTGLGLPIARMMTLQMDGFFGVSSEVGVGSTFWFELPLSTDDDSPQSSEQSRLKLLDGLTVVNTVPGAYLRHQLTEALAKSGAQCVEWNYDRDDLEEERLRQAGPVVFICDMPEQPDQSPRPPAEVIRTALLFSAPVVALAPASVSTDCQWTANPGSFRVCRRPLSIRELVHCILRVTTEFRESEQIAAEEPEDAATTSTSQLLALQGSLSHPVKPSTPELHALVADDNLVNQRIMAAMLGKLGVSCEVAGNGRVAVEMLESRRFDLVLMDCRMPVCDGLEATTIIRGAGKPYSKIPIIGVSAELEAVQRTLCLEAGMDGFMEKPYAMRGLSEVLVPYMEAARSRRPPCRQGD